MDTLNNHISKEGQLFNGVYTPTTIRQMTAKLRECCNKSLQESIVSPSQLSPSQFYFFSGRPMEVESHAPPAFDLNPGSSLRFTSFNLTSDGGGVRQVSATSSAAKRVQKVYRSYRTRRMLADSAVVAEELWWQAIDYARLNHSTISFFDFLKPETAASRWSRVSLNASKVGKGLSLDSKAQKLAFQHWIEAIDPRHRYGHSLHIYYEEWCKSNAGQPFFYWLDLGEGRSVDLKECPRSKLRKQCIKYLGPKERRHYGYDVSGGRILHKLTGNPLNTTTQGSTGSKWIFVMSTAKKLYAGEKKKGLFHHSSFLAGGATLAAGRLEADDGVLTAISAYSGHYKPTEESLDTFLLFLKENGVDLDKVEIRKAKEDYESSVDSSSISHQSSMSESKEDSLYSDKPEYDDSSSRPDVRSEYKRTLSGGLQSPKAAEVPKTAILQRINSKSAAKSYQLGHQLSVKWSTGAGPRIGCVADYPVELRWQALEITNLSPRNYEPSLPTPTRRAVARSVSSLSAAGVVEDLGQSSS